MDEHGTKIPSVKDLFRFVQDLSQRLEKTEKELARLKNVVNTRQKKAIIDWLNQPAQAAAEPFEEWWRAIAVNETHLNRVFERDLTDGIKVSLESFLADQRAAGNDLRPIRCFTQKPNTFYVYSRNSGTKEPLANPQWRIMDHAQMDAFVIHVSQLFLRVFLQWQQQQTQMDTDNEEKTDRIIQYMIKINGARVPSDKRIAEIKKWLFPKIEENLRIIMECEFE